MSVSKKKTTPLEKNFKQSLVNKLKLIPGLYFFSKEAAAIRGIPDIIGCTSKGVFFALEVKRSKSEIFYKDGRMKLHGRVVLQHYVLTKISESRGIAEFVYPENLSEVLMRLY